ncbi:Crp/Fnr family transcriptional regulator [Flavonifractor sp. HCP28S3_F3]|uniref:Crp/Fnr family transcriptional regulator n=1 Tax=Flavonifractor sp. HCP28S3_F3 TaxID=3438939 RepID=UPI003F8B3DF1
MVFAYSSYTLPSENAAELEQFLKEYSTVIQLPPKTVFGKIGEEIKGIYYIAQGRTSHYILGRDGGEKLLYTLSTGWFFGESINFLHEPSTVISKTDSATVLYKLDQHTFKRLIDESSFFRSAILLDNAKKMLIMRHEIESITFKSYKERLLKLFYVAADRTKLIDGQWYNQQIRYTQSDMSTIIGSSRITVSKLLGELCDEGFIRMLNRNIQINARVSLDE